MSLASKSERRPWPDYRAVWRWHFYAGLFCIPFVLFLATTGSIYLFKPQIEAFIDRDVDARPGAQSAAPSAAVAAALAAHPGWALHALEASHGPRAAAQVIIGRSGVERRVVVDRSDLSILRDEREDQRLMKTIFRLHGELLIGDRGSNLIELAASWAIVMILTGLYLWWPRNAKGLGGVLYPRLGGGPRLLLRDLHAVTAVWVSAFTLFILASGLPWAKNWGGYLKEVRGLTGTLTAPQDWSSGSGAEMEANRKKDADAMAGMPGMVATAGSETSTRSPSRRPEGGGGMHAEHSGRRRRDVALTARDLAALDRITPAVEALHLAPPVLIAPPSRPGGLWSAKSDAQNRTLRTDLKLDPATGAVVERTDFGQRPLVDRAVGTGVALHEGQLFGLGNQILNLTVACGLILASISAVLLWWRRRASGVLGAPLPEGPARVSAGLAALIIILGVLLPEFGVSLIIVLVAERLLLRRIPSAARWLGLRPATAGI